MQFKKVILLAVGLACSIMGKAQHWQLLSQGKGLSYTNRIPLLWPGQPNEIWPGIGLPYPLVQLRNDTSYSYFKPETDLNPYSNPLVGAYPWKDKTVLLHGFLPAYTMGIFGPCNGGVLLKSALGFTLKNSINTPTLFSLKEKFWYHSAKARLDSSVWIAADTGFRRLNLNTLQTKILKGETYKGIALYNHMAASGNHWAGFRNDYGIWCFLWGDTSVKIISGVDLGVGPNRFVFDIAETPGGDTLFTASEFLGNLQSPYRLYKRNQGQVSDLSTLVPILGDSLTFVETEADGTLWVCGRKREVFQVRGQEVRKVLLPDSLQETAITQMVIDEGNFKWIVLENRGLLRLSDIQISPHLPASKRLCMGDTFSFAANATTMGTGIIKIKWDFGFGDTLMGDQIRYACTRPGKYPYSISVWDNNGSFQKYKDSLTVDYPVGGLISTSTFTQTLCGPAVIWSDSPFETHWLLPNGQSEPRDTLSVSELGIYTLVVKNGVCIQKDSITVVNQSLENQRIGVVIKTDTLVHDTLVALLPAQIQMFADIENQMICPPQWQVNGDPIGSGYQKEFSFLQEGSYKLRFESQQLSGCPISGERTLVVKALVLEIPSLITADGNGKNDLFLVNGLEAYAQNSLTIFNRWGKEIFSASPYQNNWPPSEVSPGTYFYCLEASGQTYTGWVEVAK